jgi:hypothetical protein
MQKAIFRNQTKTKIEEILKELYFPDTLIESITERMEDQVRSLRKRTTGNLEDYSFEVKYAKTENGFLFDSVNII